MSDLAHSLRSAREQRGWSLREAERRSGISNAHLSQIERGSISQPSPSLLWDLANLYELDFRQLMVQAKHISDIPSKRLHRQLKGAALRAVDDLTEEELVDALDWLNELRHRRAEAGTDPS